MTVIWLRRVWLAAMCGMVFAGCNKNPASHVPGVSDEAVAFADSHWKYYDPAGGDFGSYLAYEYWVAKNLGPDGTLSGTIVYPGTITQWQNLSWNQKKAYLPAAGFPHDLNQSTMDASYYHAIGEYNQFAAGWPPDGDSPYNYRSLPRTSWQWTASNSYRTSYLNMLGSTGE